MPPKASLLGLPTEIRQKIFGLIIQPNDSEKTDWENRWLTEHLLHLVAVRHFSGEAAKLVRPLEKVYGHPLLLVSRACYQEAIPLLYENQGFYLWNDYDWTMWWRTQPFFGVPFFELYHAKHPTPSGFAFIRELAFQPGPELSIEFVQAIQTSFPSLHTLRAFRHIFLQEADGRLTGELPDVWREFYRFVLLAAVLVTTYHPTLKHAKWSDWRFFPPEGTEDSIRTMTTKISTDDKLSINDEGLLDLERISQLPLTERDGWKEAIDQENLRIDDFFLVRTSLDHGSCEPERDSLRPGRVRSSDLIRY